MRKFIIGWIALCALISSCAWYRHNSEQVYYGRGIWILKTFLSSDTKANCNINWNVKDPIFIRTDSANMDGYRARYRPQKVIRVKDGKITEAGSGVIEYDPMHVSALTHEAIHHLLNNSDWQSSNKSAKWCHEQIIAELVYHLARLQQYQMNMQKMNTMR